MPIPLLRRRIAAPPLAHGDRADVAGFTVRLAVSPRARRIGLRLDASRREVVATAPSARRLPEALAFAQARADWIAARLEALPPSHPFQPGAVIPLDGQPCRLERAAMRVTPRIAMASAGESARLIASGEGEAYARGVLRALKTEALKQLSEGTAQITARMGLPAPEVSVADAKGRWGSCRAPYRGDAGRIRYSWRLVCAPRFVRDYVVAHECAHLIEANHAPPFWALTERLYGDVAPARAWLKAHGPELQALGA